MLSKLFLFVLIGTLFNTAKGEESKCNKYYTCVDDTIYAWIGMKFECPEGKFCNANYKSLSGGGGGGGSSTTASPTTTVDPKTALTSNTRDAAQTCPPCVSKEVACEGIPPVITCNGLEFDMGGDIKGKCPSNTRCNQKQENGCGPCYVEKCDTDAWTCIDDVTFKTKYYNGQCINNATCRRIVEAPCDQPCKAKSALSRSIAPLWRITELK